ncbi:MAG: class II aldolase/adducin family protein [Candidatus Bathyarchaeota archaeon]|nr:class II aldolase/adducin family protein [Candidatus Bathyarchaeota archaeon]
MSVNEEIFKEFRRIGQFMDRRGLVSSHGGNLSVRQGEKMIVKRRGAMLGDLRPWDIVEMPIKKIDSKIMIASTESLVHQAVYCETDHLAVVHCHPIYTIALSLIEDEITAIDAEGAFNLKKIPILDLKLPIGPREAAIHVPKVLKNYKVVVIRTHGIFAGAETLEEAFNWATVCEEVSTIKYLTMLTGKPLLRNVSKEFHDW